MLGDAQLDACEAQLRSFRMMNGQYYETIQDILRKYESLVEDYRMLRSDYEEEKENREKYKRQARGQEKNPFVLVLVDGDGYIFKDHFIRNQREGGISAAQLMSTEVRDRLRKLGHLDHCRIVVRIYCNLFELSHALGRQGLCGHHARSIASTAAAFTGAKDHFDFIDAGEDHGMVISKIEESFRLFADAGQCKHIFFAGCHDTRYIPLLSPFLGKADKVTLIRAPAHQPEYHSLALPVEDFSSVFRDTPLPGWSPGTTSIKGAANKQALVQPEPVSNRVEQLNTFPKANGVAAFNEISSPSSVNGDYIDESAPKPCPNFVKKGWCKFGKGCKFSHPKKGPETSEVPMPKAKTKDFSGNWRDPNPNAFADDWGNNAPEPSYGDDWGASSKKSQSDLAEDWGHPPKGKKNSITQSKFAEGPRASPSGFSEDWGNGSQLNSRAGSVSNNSVASRAQRPGSISQLSVGSRQQEETRPHPTEALRSKWALDTHEPPKPKETPADLERPQPKKFNSAFTTAADLPRPSAETEGLIPVNKYGDRLDFYLPRPTAEEYNVYNTMVKEPGKKPCNEYQLKGHCPSLAAGRDCEFDHNPLSPELFHVLKVIVQGYPCPKKGACRKSDCFNGHVCQRPGCRGLYPCKFKNDYRAHKLDLKVAEWVPAIDMEERESDDSASVTMGEAPPEAKPKPKPKATPISPEMKPEAEEWHPESAAWNPDAVDWKPETANWKPDAPAWKPEVASTTKFELNNGGTWKPGVADWKPSANSWKPDDVDKSDIDSDTDSIAPQPEKEILDLGADDTTSVSIFSSKPRDGRLDSVVQTGELAPHSEAKPLVDTPAAQPNGNGVNEVQPETNLMDDDWGNPPDGAGTFAETAEPVNFDDDWGSAPPGVDNPAQADEPVDFADDWGPSNKTNARSSAPRQQRNYGGNQHGNETTPRQGGMVWPSEIQKQQQQKNDYDHLLWVRTVD